MWLYRQIKEHPYLATGITLLLGGVAFPILYLMAAAWTVYAITAAICLVAGPSLGGCLGWLVERNNLPPLVPAVFEHEARSISTARINRAFSSSTNSPILILAPYLDYKDCTALAKTSPASYRLFIPSVRNALGYKLLQHGIYGEEKKAEAILKSQPPQQLHFLLFTFEATVTDYSSRKIKGNFIRVLFGAEDIDMLKKILPYCTRAYNGDEKKAQEEIKRQYDVQFTGESKDIEAKNAAADLEALNKVIQAIHKATPTDCQSLLDEKENKESEVEGIAAELKRFRAYLDSKTEEVITSGKHFNARLLVEAFNQYNANYAEFGDGDAPKNNLFWRQVIGYIQRYLPTCYAQAFCQGILYIVNDGESLTRSLHFRFSSAYSFFPLSSEESGLGYEYAATYGDLGGAWKGGWAALCGEPTFFNSYVQQKQREGELMQHPYEHQSTTNTSCALM